MLPLTATPARRIFVLVALLAIVLDPSLLVAATAAQGNHNNEVASSAKDASTIPRVTNFALIDVPSNRTVVTSLKDHTVLDPMAISSTKLTIRVDVNADTATSSSSSSSIKYLVLDLDRGRMVRTSMTPPYALAGFDDQDTNLFYHSNTLVEPGLHTLRATPFDAKGRAGESRTITIQVLLGDKEVLPNRRWRDDEKWTTAPEKQRREEYRSKQQQRTMMRTRDNVRRHSNTHAQQQEQQAPPPSRVVEPTPQSSSNGNKIIRMPATYNTMTNGTVMAYQ